MEWEQALIAAKKKQRAEQERGIGRDEDFASILAKEAMEFAKANLVRKYIRALRRRLTQQQPGDLPAQVDEAWLQRAMGCADTIDPLVKRFPAQATAAPQPPTIPVEALDVAARLRSKLEEMGVADLRGLYAQRDQFIAYVNPELCPEVHRILAICGYDNTRPKLFWPFLPPNPVKLSLVMGKCRLLPLIRGPKNCKQLCKQLFRTMKKPA